MLVVGSPHALLPISTLTLKTQKMTEKTVVY